jgi:plastocyanin
VRYRWDFAGDGRYGASAETPVVVRRFTRAGTFRVGVLALDRLGRRATGHLRIVVLAAGRGVRRRPSHTHGAPSQPKRAPLARAAAGSSVTIKDFSFGPSAITIHAGDTVTWVNEGPSNHTATAPGVFNTGILHPRQSASQTFTHAGTFAYRCSIHPFMRAAVTVLPASGSAGTAPRSGPEAAGNSASAASTTTGAAPSAPGRALPATGLDTRSEMAAGLAMLVLGSALLVGTARGRRTRGRRRGG